MTGPSDRPSSPAWLEPEGVTETPNTVVHVVDDDEAVCVAVSLLLRAAGYAVATHPSGNACLQALRSADKAKSQLVLTDIWMPGMDGLTLLHRSREEGFPWPVVVMTGHGDVALAVRAMKAGAADFIEKPFDDEALLTTLGGALVAVAPGISGGGPLSRVSCEAARRIAALSPREREVLDRLVAGKSNKVVAHELGVSQRTIEVHRANVMERLGAASFAELVRLAVRAELAGRGEETRASC